MVTGIVLESFETVIVRGGAGDDNLSGGKGDDILDGGTESDTFVLKKGAGMDVIIDFGNSQNDAIELTGGLTIKDLHFVDKADHVLIELESNGVNIARIYGSGFDAASLQSHGFDPV